MTDWRIEIADREGRVLTSDLHSMLMCVPDPEQYCWFIWYLDSISEEGLWPLERLGPAGTLEEKTKTEKPGLAMSWDDLVALSTGVVQFISLEVEAWRSTPESGDCAAISIEFFDSTPPVVVESNVGEFVECLQETFDDVSVTVDPAPK